MGSVPDEVKPVALLPHQALFVLSPERMVLLDGGFGAAKTLALCAWAYAQCESYPNNLVLIGRHQYTDLADSTIKSFFELLPNGRTSRSWNEQSKTYRHGNGSEILFRHLDNEAGLKNLNLGAVGIDQAEEILPERFDLLLGRLRRPNTSRQVRLVTNPNGHDWVWQYFYGSDSMLWKSPHLQDEDQWSLQARDGYKVIRCTSLDNPHLPEGYVAGLLKDYSAEYVQQYVYGSRDVMLGYRFFDPAALKRQAVQLPLAVGYFVDGLPKPEWRDQQGGPIRIYEKFDERDPYIVAADVATGEGTCSSAGIIRNARFNRVAAVIDAQLNPDELAYQCWYASRYYGNAVIAPERNGIGFACVSALSKLTSNIFSEKVSDHLSGEANNRLGWVTDEKSRMQLFALMQQEIRQGSLELKDRALIEQCKAITMIKGKPKAEDGFRDDLVLACGISGMVRKMRPSLAQVSRLASVPSNLPAPELGRAFGFGRKQVAVAGR